MIGKINGFVTNVVRSVRAPIGNLSSWIVPETKVVRTSVKKAVARKTSRKSKRRAR